MELGQKGDNTLCHRHSGASLREIVERFGISESAVSQIGRRLINRMEHGEVLRVEVERICKTLKGVNV